MSDFLSTKQIEKEGTGQTFLVLCDQMGLWSWNRQEVEEFLQAIRAGLDNLSDEEIEYADQKDFMEQYPGQFIEMFGTLHPLYPEALRRVQAEYAARRKGGRR